MTVAMATVVALAAMAPDARPATAEERTPAEVVLVEEGRPVASIVLARDPTRAARLSALELQHHIRRITGALLPLRSDVEETTGPRILVGRSRETGRLGIDGGDFGPLEYLVGFRPGTVVLIGRDWRDTEESRAELGTDTYGRPLGSSRHVIDYRRVTGEPERGVEMVTLPGHFDDQGTCYATYHFLERHCGVRWYGPTELNIVCPSRRTLTVRGTDVRRSRDLKHVHALGGTRPETSWGRLGTPDRMRELGLLIREAVARAGTDLERQRVETWQRGVWDYMKAGHDRYRSRSAE